MEDWKGEGGAGEGWTWGGGGNEPATYQQRTQVRHHNRALGPKQVAQWALASEEDGLATTVVRFALSRAASWTHNFINSEKFGSLEEQAGHKSIVTRFALTRPLEYRLVPRHDVFQFKWNHQNKLKDVLDCKAWCSVRGLQKRLLRVVGCAMRYEISVC